MVLRREYQENSWGWGLQEAGAHFMQVRAAVIDLITLPILNLMDPFKAQESRLTVPLEVRRLLEILNRHPVDSQSLLEIMQSSNVNARLYVVEPPLNHDMNPDHPRKVYYAASSMQSSAKPMPWPAQGQEPVRSSGQNHTTTLANVIATNELGFSPENYIGLFDKLMEVNADFSALDYTDYFYYPDTAPFYSIQNNPLKSLIAKGSGNATFDSTISHLLRHIGSLPDEAMKKSILNARDAFPWGGMTPVYFFIRQGKEDMALEAIQNGADVSEEDLVLACHSFGTSFAERPRGVECIDEIIRRLSNSGVKLSRRTYDSCLSAMKKAGPEVYEKFRQRRRDSLAEDPDSKVAIQLRTKLNLSEKAFKDACEEFKNKAKPLSHMADNILDEAALEAVKADVPGNGRFGDYYRADEENPALLKFRYLQTDAGRIKYAVVLEALKTLL